MFLASAMEEEMPDLPFTFGNLDPGPAHVQLARIRMKVEEARKGGGGPTAQDQVDDPVGQERHDFGGDGRAGPSKERLDGGGNEDEEQDYSDEYGVGEEIGQGGYEQDEGDGHFGGDEDDHDGLYA